MVYVRFILLIKFISFNELFSRIESLYLFSNSEYFFCNSSSSIIKTHHNLVYKTVAVWCQFEPLCSFKSLSVCEKSCIQSPPISYHHTFILKPRISIVSFISQSLRHNGYNEQPAFRRYLDSRTRGKREVLCKGLAFGRIQRPPSTFPESRT